MTDAELAELLADCPTLFHMAEDGSWPSIRDYGIFSTTGLLDRYEISGADRKKIEDERRPTSVEIAHPSLPKAIVRDQLPMDDAGLIRCLPSHLKPVDWYRKLNSKVFFWLTKGRLHRLLNAGTYKTQKHDVIEVDTKSLVDAYRDRIWFCPMNSGCTKPIPHPRGDDTFLRIPDYPYSDWRRKRKAGERVVELAVDTGIPDIAQFVKRVVKMKGEKELKVLFEKK